MEIYQICLMFIGFIILVILIGLSIQKNRYTTKGSGGNDLRLIGPSYYTYYKIDPPGLQTRHIYNIGEYHTLKPHDLMYIEDSYNRVLQIEPMETDINKIRKAIKDRLPYDLMSDDFPVTLPISIFLLYLSTRNCWDIYAECDLSYLRANSISSLTILCHNMSQCGMDKHKGIKESDIEALINTTGLSSDLGQLVGRIEKIQTSSHCNEFPGLRFHQIDTRFFNLFLHRFSYIGFKTPLESLSEVSVSVNDWFLEATRQLMERYLIALYNKSELYYPYDLYDTTEIQKKYDKVIEDMHTQKWTEMHLTNDIDEKDAIHDKWRDKIWDEEDKDKWVLKDIEYVDQPEVRRYNEIYFSLLKKELRGSILIDHKDRVLRIVNESHSSRELAKDFGYFNKFYGNTVEWAISMFLMNFYTLCRVLRKEWRGESIRPLCKSVKEPVNSVIYSGRSHSKYYSYFIERFFDVKSESPKFDLPYDESGLIKVNKSHFRSYL